MPNLPLTFACGLYDRVLPLFTGEVKPEGIDLRFVVENAPRHLFDQLQGEGAFDASEMSLSDFIRQSRLALCGALGAAFPARRIAAGGGRGGVPSICNATSLGRADVPSAKTQRAIHGLCLCDGGDEGFALA
jgi:hypothetical protein